MTKVFSNKNSIYCTIGHPPLQEDEEDVSYDLESLFTNIPINVTIYYILDQIYNKNNLKPIYPKLIFKRLLLKLATEVTFTINNNFSNKQMDAQWEDHYQ